MKPEKGEPKYGYIGKTGTWIAEPKFDGMFYFRAAFSRFFSRVVKDAVTIYDVNIKSLF